MKVFCISGSMSYWNYVDRTHRNSWQFEIAQNNPHLIGSDSHNFKSRANLEIHLSFCMKETRLASIGKYSSIKWGQNKQLLWTAPRTLLSYTKLRKIEPAKTLIQKRLSNYFVLPSQLPGFGNMISNRFTIHRFKFC